MGWGEQSTPASIENFEKIAEERDEYRDVLTMISGFTYRDAHALAVSARNVLAKWNTSD